MEGADTNADTSANTNADTSANTNADTNANANIEGITFPKLGEYKYFPDVFSIDASSRQYFDRTTKPVNAKLKRALDNLKNTDSKISNSIDNSNTGSRIMESVTDFNSDNPYLQSMHRILKFFETRTYNLKNKSIKYSLLPSIISSTKITFPQIFHTDYKSYQYKSLHSNSENIPYIIFFGIDENTILYIWDDKMKQIIEHRIEVGAVLILALNVVHAGAAYINAEGKIHRRVQMYMETDDFLHDYLNPNEWLPLPIQNQPLRLVLENRMFTAEQFKICANSNHLKTVYNLDKNKVYNALLNDEENQNSRKRSREIKIDWNQCLSN
jgi:hypothetical protein